MSDPIERLEKKINKIMLLLAGSPDKWMDRGEFITASGKSEDTFAKMRTDKRYKHLFSNFAKDGSKCAYWKINYTQYLITEDEIGKANAAA